MQGGTDIGLAAELRRVHDEIEAGPQFQGVDNAASSMTYDAVIPASDTPLGGLSDEEVRYRGTRDGSAEAPPTGRPRFWTNALKLRARVTTGAGETRLTGATGAGTHPVILKRFFAQTDSAADAQGHLARRSTALLDRRRLGEERLGDAGLCFPPFHGLCRTTTLASQTLSLTQVSHEAAASAAPTHGAPRRSTDAETPQEACRRVEHDIQHPGASG